MYVAVRKASRSVTSAYTPYFDGLPITAAQCPLLTRLYLGGPLTVTVLAEFLALDRTTLARNLKPLVTQGLVSVSRGGDARARVVSITDEGRRALQDVLPVWEEAHAKVNATIGVREAEQLRGMLAGAVDALS
jgi:DNA-binding MarR family transcriptional regulator